MAKKSTKPENPTPEPTLPTMPPTLSETIRETIKARGLTGYRIAKSTGITPTMVHRFLDGFDVHGATLDKIAQGLGMRLVETEFAHPDMKGNTDGVVS